jgi:hypothetical protein
MDFKKLLERIKAKSPDVKSVVLNLTEEELQIVASESFDFIVETILATPGKYDDIAIPFILKLKEDAKKLVDKVDGQIG